MLHLTSYVTQKSKFTILLHHTETSKEPCNWRIRNLTPLSLQKPHFKARPLWSVSGSYFLRTTKLVPCFLQQILIEIKMEFNGQKPVFKSSQRLPPRRGQIKIKMFKLLAKSAAELWRSTIGRNREEKNSSSVSTTPNEIFISYSSRDESLTWIV